MELKTWAPIALFIYRRSSHLERTILSLKACEGFSESPLIVFADGPRNDQDRGAVAETRDTARRLLGKDAIFVEQSRNQGLSTSIIQGVNQLCREYGKAIVVEDDLRVAPQFLRFLNDGLHTYQDAKKVMQISGHMFDVPGLDQRHTAHLLRLTTSWGWATWKDAWEQFDPDATGWQSLLKDPVRRKQFNLGGNVDYANMLEKQMRGQIDSWAIRWYYTVFKLAGFGLFPPRTLVANEGVDGSGTHSRVSRMASQQLVGTPIWEMPLNIQESQIAPYLYTSIRKSSKRSVLKSLGGEIQRRWSSLISTN